MRTCRVVITIDTETPQSPLFNGLIRENLMEASYEGRALGATRIIEEMQPFGVKAVFFVNVYEAAMWGEAPLRELCQRIAAAGHEVGLHTHPACKYDRMRHYMWKYSLDEQRRIISDGLAMLRDWLGDRPIISHRSGAYGANEDTITALVENGFAVDSSSFHGHPMCRLAWVRNKITSRMGILEVPVTWMRHEDAFTVAGWTIRSRSRQIKTDVDWIGLDGLKLFIEQARTHGLPVINYGMHSYSFMHFEKGIKNLMPDTRDLDRFRHFLEYAAQQKLSVVTLEQLLEVYRSSPDELDGPDFLPVWPTRTPLWKGLARKTNHWVRGIC